MHGEFLEGGRGTDVERKEIDITFCALGSVGGTVMGCLDFVMLSLLCAVVWYRVGQHILLFNLREWH